METVKPLNKWANAHTYYAVDIARIALGIFLFYKGVSFFTDTGYLLNVLEPFRDLGGTLFIVHYVASAHLVGGVLITFGLLTRWAILVQLPILIGAVIVNFMGELAVVDLLTSAIALFLSVCFLAYGSGKHSADYFFKMQQ